MGEVEAEAGSRDPPGLSSLCTHQPPPTDDGRLTATPAGGQGVRSYSPAPIALNAWVQLDSWSPVLPSSILPSVDLLTPGPAPSETCMETGKEGSLPSMGRKRLQLLRYLETSWLLLSQRLSYWWSCSFPGSQSYSYCLRGPLSTATHLLSPVLSPESYKLVILVLQRNLTFTVPPLGCNLQWEALYSPEEKCRLPGHALVEPEKKEKRVCSYSFHLSWARENS